MECMDKRLSHLMKLSAKTGDRLIVVPEGTGEPFILMPVDQYESMLEGTDKARAINTVKQVSPKSSELADNYEFEPILTDEGLPVDNRDKND